MTKNKYRIFLIIYLIFYIIFELSVEDSYKYFIYFRISTAIILFFLILKSFRQK